MAEYSYVSGFEMSVIENSIIIEPGVANKTFNNMDVDFIKTVLPILPGTNYILINDLGNVYSSTLLNNDHLFLHSYRGLVTSMEEGGEVVLDSNYIDLKYLDDRMNEKIYDAVKEIDTRTEVITENAVISNNTIKLNNYVKGVISIYAENIGEIHGSSIAYVLTNNIVLTSSNYNSVNVEVIYETVVTVQK
ncbi:MAG: hypothetical protein U9R03_04480 [Candidatus Aerophobetes bacterium]|nr:hypothetical protein [Candidatus Aerophobetes bacterium]